MTVKNNYNHDFLLLKTLKAFISKFQFSSWPDALLKQISTHSLEILTVYLELHYPMKYVGFFVLYCIVKCCTVAILTTIALKKLLCTVNYMYNKNPIL